MKLICKPLMNGIMAYWDEVENASSYNVTLYINKQPISKRINERTELYCTFTGLAAIDGLTSGTILDATRSYVEVVRNRYSSPKYSGYDYYVKVEAENRNGEIIESTDKVRCDVREF